MAKSKKYEHTRAEHRIRVAISNMPYSGLETIQLAARHVGLTTKGVLLGESAPVSLESVAKYLEALRGALERIARDNQHRKNRLDELNRDILGMRRLMAFQQIQDPGDQD